MAAPSVDKPMAVLATTRKSCPSSERGEMLGEIGRRRVPLTRPVGRRSGALRRRRDVHYQFQSRGILFPVISC